MNAPNPNRSAASPSECADFRRERISLAGQWHCWLERYDDAVAHGWMTQPLSGKTVSLPGALAESGMGDEVTLATRWTGSLFDTGYFTSEAFAKYRSPENLKLPFWLQPERHYVGNAWYQREFHVPDEWKGRRLTLFLERPHWQTRVWVDGRDLGSRQSLAVPHVYDLGNALEPGKHRLSVRVDNRLQVNVGVNAHSVSDHTQGNWNGIVGRMEIVVTPDTPIEDIQAWPKAAEKAVRVTGRIGGDLGGRSFGVRIEAELLNSGGVGCGKPWSVLAFPAPDGAFEAELSLGEEARLWDEFDPALYRLTATLEEGGEERDARRVIFGLRDVGTKGTRVTVNGRECFLRGALECCVFPRTGYPPTDTASWRKILETVRAHGLNHLRFHSWCPPEAAFVAGNELGMYFQVECGTWPNQGATLGDGQPLDPWLAEETEAILRTYGNHPSFLFMACGNEPDGVAHREWLGAWIQRYRGWDCRRLYTGGAGWPEIPENQFHVSHGPRAHQWGDGLRSRLNARAPETRTDYRDYIEAREIPVISHEIGQWCAYPNFDEIGKYTGYLKAKNFEIFRDSLEAKGMEHQAKEFLLASGKLQTLCYKEEIEAALRTPGMGGFQLLGLSDFPGQGTALVGVLDAFWEPKGYVTADEYRRFCDAVVPLARLRKRLFTQGEILEADIEVANFSGCDLDGAAVHWRLESAEGDVLAGSGWTGIDLRRGVNTAAGGISISLAGIDAPVACRLTVRVDARDVSAENDWNIWMYPDAGDEPVPPGVVVANSLGDEVLSRLADGGTVLLMPAAEDLDRWRRDDAVLGFTPIFWNTAWTSGQAPHTLGILCDPKHPALASFPTAYHADWQWQPLLSRAAALVLDGLPSGMMPIVQVIDDWFVNRKLGLVFEARVGAGKLLVCGMALGGEADGNPVARQMRRSLLHYVRSSSFRPETACEVETLRGVLPEGRGV